MDDSGTRQGMFFQQHRQLIVGASGVEDHRQIVTLRQPQLRFQQRLLTMVRDIAQGIQRVDVEEALFGPWKNASALPNLSWNAGASRLYALRAGNPAKDKRGGVPAADWLGFSAWPLLPVAAVGSRLHTALFRGGWKDGSLYWPLWAVPATAFTVRALITAYPERLSPAQRTARGIDAVMRAGILRSDQGGYGSFSPAEVL